MRRTSARRWVGAALLAVGLALPTAVPAGASPTPDAAILSALSAVKAQLDRAAESRPRSVTGWYVDDAAGSVVVSVHGSAEGVAEWAAGHGAGAVTVEHVAERPRPVWDLISGQPIHSGTIRCTLGFNARSGATRYVLSAGHCVSVGREWYGVGGYIGPSVASSYPTNDYGLIRVDSATALSTPLIDRYTSGPDVTINGFGTPPVGSAVCSSSPQSGWRCGSVTGINQTVCYPQGCVYQLIRTNLCAEPGSSGAAVVTNPASSARVLAVGLVSGGAGNCSSGGTAWLQPIAEPLAAYGLTLVTG